MFLIILAKFVVNVLIKPEEYNPFDEQFDPIKTIHVAFTILMVFYIYISIKSNLDLYTFLEERHPCAIKEFQEWRDEGKVISSPEELGCEVVLPESYKIKKE